MSTEQRVKAYYKRYNQGFRDHYFSGHGTGNIYERMAQVFKMPIREIKAILGKTPREPHQYGCVNAGRSRYCDGLNVTHAPSPYAREILGDETPHWMCARCRHQSAMDI